MKVRICYTVDVEDRFRRAINNHYKRPGLATRNDVKSFCRTFGESIDADIMYDLDRAEETSTE